MDDQTNNTQSTEVNKPQENAASPAFFTRKKIIVVIAGIIIMLIICLLFLITHQQKHVDNNNKPKPAATKTTSGMNSYMDNWKLFRITVPKQWQVTHTIQVGTTGLNTAHPVTHKTEIYQFYRPGDIGITVQVTKEKPQCPLNQQLTTTIAGYPASYDSSQHGWYIPTSQAEYTVSISYPGSGGFHNSLMNTIPTKTPLSVIKADQKQLNALLQTFKIINFQPFSC